VVLTFGEEALDVKESVVVPLPTVMFCSAWVAALWLVSPAWFATSLQVPAVKNETTPEEIEHTAVLVLSTAISTAEVEVPPVAVAV
jgi:hypothetical protein